MELCGTGIWKLLLGAVYKMVIAAGAYKVMGYFDTGTAWLPLGLVCLCLWYLICSLTLRAIP